MNPFDNTYLKSIFVEKNYNKKKLNLINYNILYFILRSDQK